MRPHRLGPLVGLLLALVGPAGAVAAPRPTRADWDRPQIRAVVRAGLLAPRPEGFAGDAVLRPAELRVALGVLAARDGRRRVAVPERVLSVATFDRLLVAQLGLGDVARAVQAEARRVGLRPPRRFGSEVVARQLELRTNHPAGTDELELDPGDPITRAEAAWSLARVADLAEWEADAARTTLQAFALPALTSAQRRVLRLAVSKIGAPYVWGGESDTTASPYGPQTHGGYDCSGFAWRVLKLSGDPAGLGIRGRTAAQQAGEIPRAQRLRLGQVAPGDLLFFGPAEFGDRATERGIDHMGIALSPAWMIHASAQGVYVSPLAGWRAERFAWARRVL